MRFEYSLARLQTSQSADLGKCVTQCLVDNASSLSRTNFSDSGTFGKASPGATPRMSSATEFETAPSETGPRVLLQPDQPHLVRLE